MQSWILIIITPVFSVTWSFRNQSNMLICCSRNIYYYYQCWKSCAAHYLKNPEKNCVMVSTKYKLQKNSIYLKHWNIITLSLLSLLNKLMDPCFIKAFISFKIINKQIVTPTFWKGVQMSCSCSLHWQHHILVPSLESVSMIMCKHVDFLCDLSSHFD